MCCAKYVEVERVTKFIMLLRRGKSQKREQLVGMWGGGSKHPTPNYLYFRPLQKSIFLKELSDLLSHERSYTCELPDL